MRRLVLLALPLVTAGCTEITYNCNVPNSCIATPKPGLSLRLVNPAPRDAAPPAAPLDRAP